MSTGPTCSAPVVPLVAACIALLAGSTSAGPRTVSERHKTFLAPQKAREKADTRGLVAFDSHLTQSSRSGHLESLENNTLSGVERRVCGGVDKLKIIPFGFSNKGAFAHLEYTDEDVIGLWKLVITDLVEDKRLETVSMEDPDYGLGMRDFLKAQAAPIGRAIAKHRIRPQDLGKPAAFPLELGGRTVDLRLAHHPRPRDSDTRRHEVFLAVSGRGEKRVAELRAPGDAGCCGVLGAVASPLEPRLAVLVLRAQRGFEGALVCKVEVLGAHLKVGFAKKEASP